MLTIDGMQYSNWSQKIFKQMREGDLDCVHVTIAYHETCLEALRNIVHWNRLFEQHSDLLCKVQSAADVLSAREQGKTGVVFGFQNCSPIEDDYSLVEVFHALGVRFMQLSYNNQSLLATGCYEEDDPGITRFGRQIIREMNRMGMVIDMSHSAELSTLEAIEFSERPIAITHANPAFFHPARRNKSDTVLKALGESGGMLGFSLYPFHLRNGSDCTLEDFCRMVGDTAEMVGIDHIGIGSDLCQDQPDSVVNWMRNGRWSKDTDYGEGSASNAGWPAQPDWFGNSTDYRNIVAGLENAGFSSDHIEKVMGKNWMSFFEKSFGPM
ncbi:MAG: membrane dipeptidase [Gammaproteobacteria bacterium]|nr:membrane dipeptidase [Gammaproteobacteria bacterium]